MNKSIMPKPRRLEPAYLTMLSLVILGFLVMLGTFVLGPLMQLFR